MYFDIVAVEGGVCIGAPYLTIVIDTSQQNWSRTVGYFIRFFYQTLWL